MMTGHRPVATGNFRANTSCPCKCVAAGRYVRCDLGMLMRLSILRSAALFFSVPVCAFAANSVVNLSHYDMMRRDLGGWRGGGILVLIKEATYRGWGAKGNILEGRKAGKRAVLFWVG